MPSLQPVSIAATTVPACTLLQQTVCGTLAHVPAENANAQAFNNVFAAEHEDPNQGGDPAGNAVPVLGVFDGPPAVFFDMPAAPTDPFIDMLNGLHDAPQGGLGGPQLEPQPLGLDLPLLQDLQPWGLEEGDGMEDVIGGFA